MESKFFKSTVYFDGSCSLCRAEIRYYLRKDQERALCFVDISKTQAAPPEGISQQDAMTRFHVRTEDGRLLSGAAAFVEVWHRLPGWRWAARAASVPATLNALEWGYRFFLPIRPFISRLFGCAARIHAIIDRAKRK